MSLCKHWTTSRYNTHYLRLTSVLYGTVSWGTDKSDTPWVARFLDKDLGSFKEFEQAQLAVEKEAQIQANTINSRLKERGV